MDATPSFSERHGFASQATPITIRYEAPAPFRQGILAVAIKSGFAPETLRWVICHIIDEIPDEAHNWGASNIMRECADLIAGCEWFEVYDICEALANRKYAAADEFEKNLNRFFEKKGIGWKMEGGLLSIRGEADYERTVTEAQTLLEESGRQTAAGELGEALRDLSRRPEPDITGAVQHSMAALECLAKDISGGSSKTLGPLIPGLKLPRPIDEAVEKMWGFASNQGRHISEGREPDLPEAMLTVHFCAVIIGYLTQKRFME